MMDKEKPCGDLRRAKEILASIEWVRTEKAWQCPSCGATGGGMRTTQPSGLHWAECELARFLKLTRVI